MQARQILERKGANVVTVAPTATVAEVLEVLASHNIGAVVVSGDGTAVDGILSERDIVRRVAAAGPAAMDQPASDLMKRHVVTCSPATSTGELMELMTEHRFRHVPVLDEDGLVGIVSIGDVVKVRIDELASEHDQLVDYIQSG